MWYTDANFYRPVPHDTGKKDFQSLSINKLSHLSISWDYLAIFGISSEPVCVLLCSFHVIVLVLVFTREDHTAAVNIFYGME